MEKVLHVILQLVLHFVIVLVLLFICMKMGLVEDSLIGTAAMLTIGFAIGQLIAKLIEKLRKNKK